jgi:hypothetical protein
VARNENIAAFTAVFDDLRFTLVKTADLGKGKGVRDKGMEFSL